MKNVFQVAAFVAALFIGVSLGRQVVESFIANRGK